MDRKLYKSAVEGKKTILTNTVIGDEYYLQQTFETKNNVVHIAVGYQQHDFVKEALGKFPMLVCQTNSNKNTPFHVAAETGNTSILELLVNCCHKLAPAETRPWRVQNSEGNTPLHIALIHCKVQFAAELVKEDPEITSFRNNSRETPLHLAIKHYIDNDRKSVVGALTPIFNKMKGARVIDPCPPEGSSREIVTLLLEKNRSAACFRNSDGLSPLLVALSCKTPYLLAIKSMLNYCPQSIEVCDFSEKTVLHLLSELSFENELSPEGGFFEYLLSIPEIHGLKNYQDLEGNTPAHMAVKKQNILMVELLVQLSTNFAIKNKDGLSAANLIQQNIDKFKDLLTIKRCDLFIPCARIEGEKERLEMLISKLQGRGVEIKEFDYTELKQEGNILRTLIYLSPWKSLIWKEEEVQEFIKQVLESCPALICETDRDGRTPLHNTAERDPDFIDESVLKMFSHYFKKLEDDYGVKGLYLPPWRIQDCDGNTPVHCALPLDSPISYATVICDGSRTRCVRQFFKFDIKLVEHQNNKLQTPLHLLAGASLFSSESLKELEDLCGKEVLEACELRDKDGLTPILKAAQNNLLPHVRLLYTLSQLSTYARRGDGKTFWHLLASRTSFEPNHENFEQFLTILKPEVLWGLSLADNDGNTALHLAIEDGNFRYAQFLIEKTPESLRVRNKKGFSPADLIASAEHIPRHFNDFLWSKLEIVKNMMVVRSLSGVSTLKMENYTNTIGVVAALLATVTFTAAFTVPGGLDTNNGTPLLLKKTTFQVFMISDVVAMCLSMMVLFCLQWIITMSNKKESVVLLDLSIFLLEASIYATLVAFMTGIYVTTYHITPWVGILSCALCSSLILLMHKRFLAFSTPCLMHTFFVSQKAISLLSEYLLLLLCWIPKSVAAANENNEGSRSSIGHGTKAKSPIST